MQLPNYFYVLNQVDKYQYTYLRALMSAPANKNQRNKRIETFTEAIEAIKAYAVRGDKDDWRRCLVCGIFWFSEGIAINTRQLRLLIFKCKSSINGSLQKMGYLTNMGRSEAANLMISAIPMLKDNAQDLRQWTVRQKGVAHDVKPAETEASSPELDHSCEVVDSKAFSIEESAGRVPVDEQPRSWDQEEFIEDCELW